MTNRLAIPTLLAAAILGTACDSPSAGSAAGDQVSINFTARTSGASAQLAPAESASLSAAAGQLVLTGDNGVLTLTDLRAVVARFRLRGDDDVNRCEDNGGGDDCDDFNVGPLFINLPFDGVVTVDAGSVKPGTYDEVEFRVKNLDDNDDDSNSDDDAGEAARTAALLQQIRAEIPNWPQKASMMVSGTFQPRANGTLGAAQPFRVFVRAELRTRVPLNPPLVLTETSAAPQVTITLDPAVLFRSGTQVANLAASNNQLIELRVDRGFRGEGHSGRR
ncbi:MAG TPA: hypothetical protein VF584_06440 [Longimicrobium sp.]|jgi:hypothetical protein